MREDVAVSQPAVRDTQREGVSETRSEASKRRGDKGGLGCSSPDSLRRGPARAGPGKRDRFQNPQTARGDAQSVTHGTAGPGSAGAS